MRTGGPSPWTTPLCGPGEACCPDAVYWSAPSHERGHDRFVLRPSANHPCRTRLKLRQQRSEPARATRATPAAAARLAPDSVCGPGTARRSSSPGTSVCDPVSSVVACGSTPLLSPPPVTAWKSQKVPIAAASGITPPCGARGLLVGEPNISHGTAITPHQKINYPPGGFLTSKDGTTV